MGRHGKTCPGNLTILANPDHPPRNPAQIPAIQPNPTARIALIALLGALH
jgi:hypothetical protein